MAEVVLDVGTLDDRKAWRGGHDGNHRRLELCASAARWPSRNAVQKRARASVVPRPSTSCGALALMGLLRLRIDLQRRRSSSRSRLSMLARPREVGDPAS